MAVAGKQHVVVDPSQQDPKEAQKASEGSLVTI
jgi:hypothetical protein